MTGASIPDWQPVVLVKVAESNGHLRVGARFESKHAAELSRDDAINRAYRVLARSYPDDNPACWEVVDQ